MGVELRVGYFGVTREHEIVGPFSCPDPEMLWPFEAPNGESWWPDGGYGGSGRESIHDIIATFPTESAARAWVNRKPLWRRAMAAIGRVLNLAFGGPYGPEFKSLRLVIWLLAAFGLIVFLTSCAPNRPYPHSPRCTEDGAHTHTTNGQSPEAP